MNIIVAIILTLGAGVSKLYLSKNTEVLFWSGLGLIVILFILFVLISKGIHNNIEKLKDL